MRGLAAIGEVGVLLLAPMALEVCELFGVACETFRIGAGLFGGGGAGLAAVGGLAGRGLFGTDGSALDIGGRGGRADLRAPAWLLKALGLMRPVVVADEGVVVVAVAVAVAVDEGPTPPLGWPLM
jgi:hypothetical protein